MRRLAFSIPLLLLAATIAGPASAAIPVERLQREGKLLVLDVTTAPFEVGKRYKSMQGPVVVTTLNLRDLEAAGGRYRFTAAPKENSPTHALTTRSPLAPSTAGTELWWFRAAKIEVLDPQRDVVINPGFLCHANIDPDPKHRTKLFPNSPGFSERLVTFTAGQMEVILPEGYGVPVASEENWRFVFQALNQNLEGTHTFRHRMTLYFSRERELLTPIKPLTWTIAWVTVPLDGGEEPSAVCACCGKLRNGIEAAAATGRYRMKDGRNATGHWVVPVGNGRWHSAVREFTRGLDRDRELMATWVHVHPFVERMTLRAYEPNCESPRDVWTSRIKNLMKGVGLEDVETLSTAKGIPLPASSNYEVEIVYNNTSGVKQDAMGMMGLFMTATEWQAPEWIRSPQTGSLFAEFTDQPPTAAQANSARTPINPQQGSGALFHQLPLYSGPASVEDKPYRVEMETEFGTVRFRVHPAWAPKTAAALRRVFAHNLYAGLDLRSVGDGFALQVPEVRPSGLPNEDDRALLFRLPIELNPRAGARSGRLSMSMWPGQENSVTSSFSFLLRDAPHLDGKHTIFAEVDDDTSKRLLEQIAQRANQGKVTRIVRTAVID